MVVAHLLLDSWVDFVTLISLGSARNSYVSR
jgi:hypothetical protein